MRWLSCNWSETLPRSTSNYNRLSNLPGSIMMPLSKLKTPSTVIPTNLNGNMSIQKIG